MRRRVMFILYGLVIASAVAWLLIGLAPTLAALLPAVHRRLHVLGEGDGSLASLAAGIANTAHGSDFGLQVVLDYLFSALNLAAGIFILRLRPDDRAARLLALGMIGTAVAFNLQGHDALGAIPAEALVPVSIWHDLVHVGAGVAYLYALLLFPTGRLRPGPGRTLQLGWLPVLFVATVGVTNAALRSVDDHTVGLVVLFGVVTPLAGIGSQLVRARLARSAPVRRQSLVAVKLLFVALLIAAPLMVLTAAQAASAPRRATRSYEFTTPSPGTYFFVCDPHPDDMTGRFVVVPKEDDQGRRRMPVFARDSEFDTRRIVVPAGTRVRIDFTNFDADLHNVAVYTDATRAVPIFVGTEFSGHAIAHTAFRTFRASFVAIPIALFAVLIRFRLWDIDKAVSRTIVYGALVALIGGAYVGIVTALGELVGSRSLPPALYVVLTGAVAVAVQPLRARAERAADRLVYGRRAVPYHLMGQFTRQLATAVSLDEVLPRTAEAAARATAARCAVARVFLPGAGARSATWPEGALAPEDMERVLITYQGDTVGEIGIAGGRDPTGVLADLASSAGLALHNVRLAGELRERLDEITAQAEELRISRRRVVAAQGAERRRLERDIHDGAQQQLVALRVHLRLAETVLASSPEKAGGVLDDLVALATDALDTLRALAGGVFPPLLAQRGLVTALEAEAARVDNAKVVASDEVRVARFDEEVEQTVYFACLEALQNASKHSGARKVRVSLDVLPQAVLEFVVTDDGRGFDSGAVAAGSGTHNMADRLAAVGGTIDIVSQPGEGTTVSGRIPLQRAAAQVSSSVSGPNSDFGT